ncbi:MAG: sugar ABC transporter permease [Actinobacteria bacterium]|nr:sugar ABC transporter permease [Actinomycetota bacterium]
MNFLKINFEKIRKNKFAYFMLSPGLSLWVVFYIFGFFWIVVASFQKGSIASSKEFIGFKNYINVFNDPLFLKTILNTIQYMFLIVIPLIIFSLLIAIILNKINKRMQNITRALLFIPMLTSIVAAAIIWRIMVNPDMGIISNIFKFFSIQSPNWFGDPKFTKYLLSFIEIWRQLPFFIVTFLAAIQNVDKELLEAGYLDGANYLQLFIKIILPVIKPVLLFGVVMSTIWSLQLFASVYVLTKGGPVDSTSSLVWYIYQYTFLFSNVGKGMVATIILLILIFIITFINLKILKYGQEG